MAAHIVAGGPVQQRLVDGIPVVQGPLPQEGIPHRVVPDLIDILLALAGVAGVKVQRHPLHRADRHVLRQVVVQRRQQPPGGMGLSVFRLTQNSRACTPVSVREQALMSSERPVIFPRASWNTCCTVRAFS